MIVSCVMGSLSTSLEGSGFNLEIFPASGAKVKSFARLRIISGTPSSHYWGHLCKHEKYVAGCSGKAIELKTHLPWRISFQPIDNWTTPGISNFNHSTPFDLSNSRLLQLINHSPQICIWLLNVHLLDQRVPSKRKRWPCRNCLVDLLVG